VSEVGIQHSVPKDSARKFITGPPNRPPAGRYAYSPAAEALGAAAIFAIVAFLPFRSQLTSAMVSDKSGLEATQVSGSLIGIQYEHWFSGPDSWKTAEQSLFWANTRRTRPQSRNISTSFINSVSTG
jgi:hypothetical protein